MNGEKEFNERLFAYGTLQDEPVQLTTFGRTLEGAPDALVGYSLVMIRIEDQKFVANNGDEQQRNLQFTGNAADLVEGTVFTVSGDELNQADAYEPQGYERVLVQLRSGTTAWVYLDKQQRS